MLRKVVDVCLNVLLQKKESSPCAASRRVLWPLSNWKWEPPPVEPLLCEAAAAAITFWRRRRTCQEVLPWPSSLDRLVASGGLGWRAISEPWWTWKWAGCWTFRLVRPEALPREEHEMSQLKRLALHCPHLTSGQREPESLTRVWNPAPVSFPWVLGSPWMIHGGSLRWGTSWRALDDRCSRALLFFPSLAAHPSKSLTGRRLCCRPVGGRARGGTTQHITAREKDSASGIM